MRDNVVLFPHIQRDIEKIVERQDNLIEFRKNITELAKRNWRMYRGESAQHTCYGSDGFHLSPQPCCVCGRIMGLAAPENAFMFWASSNGEFRALCIDCHRRWHNNDNDSGQKVPA